MGTKKIRGWLLIAAAGALWASGAAASFYSHETNWRGYLGFGDKYFSMSFVAGDGSFIGASYAAGTSNEGGYVGYSIFDSSGHPGSAGLFWERAPVILESAKIYGFMVLNGRGLGAFSVYYFDSHAQRYYSESYLKYDGKPGWEIKTDDFGHFRSLARTPDGQYFYCYRDYLGGFRVCKMTASGTVVSYFTPAADPDDMAVDATGFIYASSADVIRKYDGNGSFIGSWSAPVALTDVSVDAQNRVLAFSRSNKYTYVFSNAGALLGSFTGPYGYHYLNIRYSDTGPDGKYYVGGCYGPYWYDQFDVEMYRFAPSPTNILPTSFGKIKAIFN